MDIVTAVMMSLIGLAAMYIIVEGLVDGIIEYFRRWKDEDEDEEEF
jgi:hypothetical protein